MQYTATTRNSRYFEVTDEWQNLIGTLQYNIWLVSQAQIVTIDNNQYDIASTGFWQTKKTVTRNGIDYAELKANMGNGISIDFANGQSLLFKRKSQWSNGEYVLLDDAGNKIATMEANFSWSSFTYNYSIATDATMPDRESNTVLPMIMVYCAKYIRMRGAG
ncbi:hypothetical protein ACTHGU_21300 [Chitinophagaceae bacterium MMS25-I14]